MNKISSIMPCLFVVSATSSTLAAEPYAKLDASTCRPKTIVASDFRFNRDSRRKEDVIAELPDAVWEKFVLAANDVISRLSDDDLKYFHCPDLMPAAFRIALANKLDLYVARIDGRHGGSFHFVLHDPKTGSASQ